MSGYVRAHRKRFKHHLFASQKFCRGYAWDWLVAAAQFKPGPKDVGGRTVTLERGQLCFSIRFLAEAWNWDKAAVSRFIARLKTETMIETRTETGRLIITICNYDDYQADGKGGETPPETPTETVMRQQRDSSETKKKKDLKDLKDNDDDTGGPLTENQVDIIAFAAGVDRSKTPSTYWNGPGVRQDINRWLEAGLSQAEIIAVIQPIAALKGEPVSKLTYFDRPIRDFLRDKLRPAITPTDGGNHGNPAKRRSGPGRTDETVDAVLHALSAMDSAQGQDPEPVAGVCQGA